MLNLFHNQGKGQPIGGKRYTDKVLGYSPIAYWPLNEASGTTAQCLVNAARDGTYTNTPTLNQTGIGDGNGAPLFDPSSNEYVDIYSASLNTAFNGALGSMSAWIKVSGSGVWTDGANRNPFCLFVDWSNLIYFIKDSGNNTMGITLSGGGTAVNVNKTSYSPTGWKHWACTWSEAADAFKVYESGTQTGTTQTGLGTWAGNLSNSNTLIAGLASGSNHWDGYVAHVAVWDAVLSDAQILALATV